MFKVKKWNFKKYISTGTKLNKIIGIGTDYFDAMIYESIFLVIDMNTF